VGSSATSGRHGDDLRRRLERVDGREFGGSSTVALEVVEGDPPALRISGTVAPGAFIGWAGAFFTPGPSWSQPVDLSAFSGLAFLARGHC